MAMFEVGMCYLQGLGVKADSALALEYLRCAARMGDIEAQEGERQEAVICCS
jgi:TPR repeat protein